MKQYVALDKDVEISPDIELPKTLKKIKSRSAVELLKESYLAEIRLKKELEAVKGVRNGILDNLDLEPDCRYFTECHGEYLVFYKIEYSEVDKDKLKKSSYYRYIAKKNLERKDWLDVIDLELKDVKYYVDNTDTKFKLESVLKDVAYYRVQSVKEFRP